VLTVKVGAFPGGLGDLVGALAGWLARRREGGVKCQGWGVSWWAGQPGWRAGGLGRFLAGWAVWLARWQVGWRAGEKGVLNVKVGRFLAGRATWLARWRVG
jgi:hypothetical protein